MQLHGSDEDDGGAGAGGLSKHQRRTAAMQARIAAMEAAAVGDKDWFLRGEAQAGAPPPPSRPRSCRHSPSSSSAIRSTNGSKASDRACFSKLSAALLLGFPALSQTSS